MTGAARQRCRALFVRNAFALTPEGSAEMAAATIRALFAQPAAETVRSHHDTAADMPGKQLPKAKAVPTDAKEDLTAFADFPQH
nr:transposase [Streptomyces sp. NRRL F-2664]